MLYNKALEMKLTKYINTDLLLHLLRTIFLLLYRVKYKLHKRELFNQYYLQY